MPIRGSPYTRQIRSREYCYFLHQHCNLLFMYHVCVVAACRIHGAGMLLHLLNVFVALT